MAPTTDRRNSREFTPINHNAGSASGSIASESSDPDESWHELVTVDAARTMGLHQRRPREYDSDGSYYSDYRNAPNSRGSSSKLYASKFSHASQLPFNKRTKRSFCGRTAQLVLLVVACLYLILVYSIYRNVTRNDTPSLNDHIIELASQLQKIRAARTFLDEKETMIRDTAIAFQQHGVGKRKLQSQPPPAYIFNGNEGRLEDYEVLMPNDVSRDMYPYSAMSQASRENNLDTLPASTEDLCGFYAQNASLSYPEYYIKRDALGPRSRVLITGITSSLGIHLAFTIQERCGANVVAAIESTYPNTVEDRMRLIKPLELLDYYFPKLEVVWGHMGVDPIKKSKKQISSEVAGEIDLVATYEPTHIVHLSHGRSAKASKYTNVLHPYVDGDEDYFPSMYTFRSSLAATEQFLSTIALKDHRQRPHFIYLSSALDNVDNQSELTRASTVQMQSNRMQELLADTYYNLYGVQSVSMRLPNAILGQWGSVDSDIYRALERVTRPQFNENDAANASVMLELLHIDDAVEGFIAAMQFRLPGPVAFHLPPEGVTSADSLKSIGKDILLYQDTLTAISPPLVSNSAVNYAEMYLKWFSRTSIRNALVRTMAWHLDQHYPYGLPANSSDVSADSLFERYSLDVCDPNDAACRVSLPSLPCASECASTKQCTPSMFDSLIAVMHEVTEGCDIALYTQALDRDTAKLRIHTDYMEDGAPLICTVAVVGFESSLVQTVIAKVPDTELVNFGVTPKPEDLGRPEVIQELKKNKLNGRLLYQGWILVWPDDVPEVLPQSLASLLKLSPGRMFAPDVKRVVYIEESYGISPTHDDIAFLAEEMSRPALPKRTVKTKVPPKTEFRLPAEPKRRAVILMSELRYQESSKSERIFSESKISLKQASRFMLYENDPGQKKETAGMKRQREYYSDLITLLNRNDMRSSLEPQYSFNLNHWARTRWIMHDIEGLEEARQLRCEWYQEHSRWEDSSLDQLSFAFVMAKREVERRIAFNEFDDRTRKGLAEKTEMKKLLTDSFEWHSLETERNRGYSPYGDLQAVPYDSADTDEEDAVGHVDDKSLPLLFVRIVSDRNLAFARKARRIKQK
jgi:nucleoside-diphosphate-sugar epimerase